MGFVFNGEEICISDEWQEKFIDILATLNSIDAIIVEDMQVDNRNVVYSDD